MATENTQRLARALWRLYRRPDRPAPWRGGGNLPWNEPSFAARMLREHLDDSHGAASRVTDERALQIDWIWRQLGLRPGLHLLDVTCGPGLYAVPLAQRGLHVTGVDFSPAAIAYARDRAQEEGVAARCTFVEADVRAFDFGVADYDAALFLYGQLAVFPRTQAETLLHRIHAALRPGGPLLIELLNQDRVDRSDSSWWFTDDKGLWGDRPFLSLGERFWEAEDQLSCERYYIVHLETGEMDEILLCDQTYAAAEMTAMLHAAGFADVALHKAWDGLPLYDAEEWNVYVAR